MRNEGWAAAAAHPSFHVPSNLEDLCKITSIKFIVEKTGEVASISKNQEVHSQASSRVKNDKKKVDYDGYNRCKYASSNSRSQTICGGREVYTRCSRSSKAYRQLYGGTLVNRKHRSDLCCVHECSLLHNPLSFPRVHLVGHCWW